MIRLLVLEKTEYGETYKSKIAISDLRLKVCCIALQALDFFVKEVIVLKLALYEFTLGHDSCSAIGMS